MLDIRKLLEKGQAAQDAEHAAKEVAKRGNMRGGSAGVVGTDGKIYGECHRVALARMLGADKEHEPNRAIMFDSGNAAEDTWATKLTAAGVTFRREEEIPVVFEVAGKKATGRPDIVIGATVDGVFTPQFGIENKGVYSAGTAVRVEFEGVPDPKHLAQAGFYSMALNIPYVIAYTNPSVIEVPYWAKKFANGAKKLQPFYRLFYLQWSDDGILQYRDERKADWVTTMYSKSGIVDFFTLVAEMEEKRDLGPRPEGGYADGTPLPWDKCQYCSHSKNCDANEDNFDAWIAEAKSE